LLSVIFKDGGMVLVWRRLGDGLSRGMSSVFKFAEGWRRCCWRGRSGRAEVIVSRGGAHQDCATEREYFLTTRDGTSPTAGCRSEAITAKATPEVKINTAYRMHQGKHFASRRQAWYQDSQAVLIICTAHTGSASGRQIRWSRMRNVIPWRATGMRRTRSYWEEPNGVATQ